MTRKQGFTLIELMFSLAVAAIMLAVGIPGFQNFIERNRLSSRTNQLVSALHLARSEAIKQRSGNLVILCKSNSDGTACNPTGTWAGGWLLFGDQNGDRIYTAGTDLLVRRYEPNPRLSITTTANYQCWLGFSSNGYLTGSGTNCLGGLLGNGTFKLCQSQGASLRSGRSVIINTLGRIRTEDIPC